MRPPAVRRGFAEFLGTGLLVATVVGSGIAAQRLSADPGLRLLENSVVTAVGLAVLILVLRPVSGAHLNPVVTIADCVLRRHDPDGPGLAEVALYLPAQCVGGIAGALLANAMFDVPAGLSRHDRTGGHLLLGEVVATAGLVLVIFALARNGSSSQTPWAVGGYIGAAYWVTSSTSFANPAVTVGRQFSDTFAGIAPASVLPFIAAQLVGTAVGVGLMLALYPDVPAVEAQR
jgi:glycerol uptake facilitator-like aquaporin